jgi:hypothetical protein
MLGSRSTALLYPSAFETLARRQPHFRPLAERVRQAWRARAVPLPSEIDFCNAIRLADDALDAATAAGTETASAAMEPASVERIDMAKAGIAIRRNGRLALYVNWRMGGVIVIYARMKDGWRLAYEDSGYLIESASTQDVWLTRMPDAGQLMNCSAESVRLQASFYRSLHDEVTPLRLIALRILNMTLLRFQWLADLFRKMVVMKLMGRKVAAPVSLERTIDIDHTLVTITDRFATGRHASRSLLGAALYRCRRVTGTHMASARYLQEVELAALPSGWKESVAPNVAGAGPLTTKVDLS